MFKTFSSRFNSVNLFSISCFAYFIQPLLSRTQSFIVSQPDILRPILEWFGQSTTYCESQEVLVVIRFISFIKGCGGGGMQVFLMMTPKPLYPTQPQIMSKQTFFLIHSRSNGVVFFLFFFLLSSVYTIFILFSSVLKSDFFEVLIFFFRL